MKRIVVLLALTLSLAASAQATQPEGYRITSYNGQTHEWTIIRTGTFDTGKPSGPEFQTKRIIVVCKWFEESDKTRTYGPDACRLRVGQFLSFKLNPLDANAPILNVDELGDTLLITEGTIDRSTHQVFQVKKIELVQP